MHVQQAIQTPLGISVLGTAILHAVPDYAEVDCAVVRTALRPPAAFSEARDVAAKVHAVLRELGIDESRTSRIRLSPESTWDADRRVHVHKGFSARIAFHLLVRDLDRVEAVLSGVVDAGADVLERCAFKTAKLAEVRRRARQDAVRAAREKAEVYASAAQVELGAVLHIEDVDPNALRGAEGHVQSIQVEAASGALEPGSIPVSAAVHITFAIV